jgi:hypothetical protein
MYNKLKKKLNIAGREEQDTVIPFHYITQTCLKPQNETHVIQ